MVNAAVMIRQAERRDVSALVELNAHVHQPHVDAHPDIFRTTDDRSGVEDYFTSLLSDSSQHVLIAELDGSPVGYLVAEVQRRPARTFAQQHDRLYVHQVSVDARFRRRGVGSALLTEVMRIARTESIGDVALDTWTFNRDAQRFFEAMGFSVYNVRMWRRDRESIGPS